MTCDHHSEGVGICGQPAHHRYLTGWRCPEHTPAAVAGRAEPPVGPGWPKTMTPRPIREYGYARDDPLGRTGWSPQNALPKREDGDPPPPHKRRRR